MSRLSSIIAALQDRIVKGATKTELPPGTLIDCQPPFDINHGERISLDELRWRTMNSCFTLTFDNDAVYDVEIIKPDEPGREEMEK